MIFSHIIDFLQIVWSTIFVTKNSFGYHSYSSSNENVYDRIMAFFAM